MIEAALLALGLVVGAVAGWLIAAARAGRQLAATTAELGGQAQAAAARAEQIEQQLRERVAESERLRGQLDAERAQRIKAQTRLEEQTSNLAEQKKLLDEADKRLKETFEALSSRALRTNREEFTKQAAEKIRPLADALKTYEEHLREVEKTRRTAYGELTERLKQVASMGEELTRQTTSLSTALRTPKVKGRWGELTLRNAVELAGLSAHCDFTEQKTVDSDHGQLRPDLLVRLPGDRLIVVDAKTPTSAYLDALAANAPEVRAAALERHAQAMRQHMRELSGKRYAEQFERTPEFVVMFVPGESFFSAALEADRELIADGIRQGVILASPTTLIALLRTVAHGWQQQDLLENARRIGEVATELYDRISKFAEHFGKVGKELGDAIGAYNNAVGSWERRILPTGRRISELGIRPQAAASMELEALDIQPRTPTALPEGPTATEA